MNRDPLTGRFISHAEACALIVAAGDRRRRWERRERLGPPAAVILANPTDRFPRWRLRVFDRCWPWRASRGQAVAGARTAPSISTPAPSSSATRHRS